MRVLIIGGTRFLGRHIAELALQRGHHLTLLHRGRSGPDLFPDAEHRIADRDDDLAVLATGEWDSVIDTSAYVPRQVRALAAALAGRVGQYQLISSISAYARFDADGTDENAALDVLPDPTVEAITGDTYGGLKALCEQAAVDAYGARCLIARPGLIVGPFDPTGRFTWWPTRVARGGEVLAPGDPSARVQFIDARDCATWLLDQAQAQRYGRFNLTGPNSALTMGELLNTAQHVLNPQAQLTWVDEAFLLAQGVAPWSEMPVWLPQKSAAMHAMNIGRAIATGLVCRPLAQTLADTAEWARSVATPLPAGVGLSAEREAALLHDWAAHPARA